MQHNSLQTMREFDDCLQKIKLGSLKSIFSYSYILIPLAQSGHILDLYYVRPSNAAPFCENYAKLYFDAKRT